MLILLQGTLFKDTLPQGTPSKAMLHSTLNNNLLGKKPVFLKDGMSSFLFLAITSVAKKSFNQNSKLFLFFSQEFYELSGWLQWILSEIVWTSLVFFNVDDLIGLKKK